MLLVMASVLIFGVLSLSFLTAQSTTTTIARNVEGHAEARGVAESALSYAVAYLRETDNWRQAITPGQAFADVALAGGTATIVFDDDTNDFNDDTADPAIVRVVGNAGGVSHRVEAHITPTPRGATSVLLVVGSASLTADDQGKKTLFESWGYEVEVIDDEDSATAFADAALGTGLIYVSETSNSSSVGTKLTDFRQGIVIEEGFLVDELALSESHASITTTRNVLITRDDHPITSGFATGELRVFDESESVRRYADLASGAAVLGTTGGDPVLVAADRGAAMVDGSVAAGRRVLTPWGQPGFAVDQLTDDGRALLRATLSWAGAEPPDVSGLRAAWHFDTGSPGSVDNIDWTAPPDHVTRVSNVDFGGPTNDPLSTGVPDDHFALRLTGAITVPEAGSWSFRLTSDDCSRLRIGGDTVVNNDGDHATRERTGSVSLEAEARSFEVLFYENQGQATLELEWRGPGVSDWEIVPPSAFDPAAQNPGEEPQLLALYEFQQVLVDPVIVGHWSLDGLEPAGIVAGGSITMQGNASVDSYDSTFGPYSGSSAGVDAVVALDDATSNALTLSDSSVLSGDAYVGHGADPAVVVRDDSTLGITGATGTLPDELAFLPLDAASGLASGARNLVVNGGSHRISSDAAFDSITIQNGASLFVDAGVELACRRFTVDGSAVVFEGPATLQVQQDLTLHNDATITFHGATHAYVERDLTLEDGVIRFEDQGALDAWVGGDAELSNDSAINPDSSDTGRVQLLLYDHDRRLDMDGTSVVAGLVRAEGDARLDVDARIFGVLQAGGDVVIRGNAALHQDNALTRHVMLATSRDDAAGNEGWSRGATPTDDGRIGGAVSFDGDEDHLVIAHDDAYMLDGGAVSFWFRTDQPDALQTMLSKESKYKDEGGHILVQTDSGRVRARMQSKTTDYWMDSSRAVLPDTWHFVTVTWGANGLRLYVDDAEPESRDYTGGLGDTSGGDGNAEPIVLGANAWESDDLTVGPLTEHFRGEIDDVRLYNQNLTDEQVENLRNGDAPGSGPATDILDTSEYGDALDLTIGGAGAVSWIDGGGIDITGEVRIESDGPATKLYQALTATNELTIEAIFAPANITQDGPARIVSMSQDQGRRNFTLGQDDEDYALRLRTTESSSNGTPQVGAGVTLVPDQQEHVIASYNDAGEVVLRRNDAVDVREPEPGGDFSGWNASMGLILANEFESERPWEGRITRIAIYDRAVDRVQAERMFGGGAPGLPGSADDDVTLEMVWIEGP